MKDFIGRRDSSIQSLLLCYTCGLGYNEFDLFLKTEEFFFFTYADVNYATVVHLFFHQDSTETTIARIFD